MINPARRAPRIAHPTPIPAATPSDTTFGVGVLIGEIGEVELELEEVLAVVVEDFVERVEKGKDVDEFDELDEVVEMQRPFTHKPCGVRVLSGKHMMEQLPQFHWSVETSWQIPCSQSCDPEGQF